MASVMVRALAILILLVGISKAANWEIELIDHAGTGKFSSLKIDKDGNAHLIYIADDGKETLRYAFCDHLSKRWFLMNVAEGASFPSLVLDSKQRPHLSYADAGTIFGSKLQYVHWNGTSWQKETVPLKAEMVGFYTSIGLDPNDNPSISFYEVDGPKGSGFRVRMRVVTSTGKYWQVSTVDGSNQSGKFNSLAVDARGHIHLAYANVNARTAGARYGFWDGTSWKVESVDSYEQNDGQYVGYAMCIALDKEGNPHLSYMNSSSPAVKYAVRQNDHWQVQEVDRLLGVGYPDRNSIVVDDYGRPYIAYYDAGAGMLKLAHREGKTWLTEIIDNNGCGFTSSLQIDRGFIWVSYADEGNNGLKIARRALTASGTTTTKSSAADPIRVPVKAK